MTVDDALELGLKTLAAAGITDYAVQVIEEFTDVPLRAGMHSSANRMITLSAFYLSDDDEMRRTIQHEVAHSLAPGDHDHGLPFQVALEHVQNLDVAGFTGPYRQQEED
jgi:uncharacterized protein (DUF934 family)